MFVVHEYTVESKNIPSREKSMIGSRILSGNLQHAMEIIAVAHYSSRIHKWFGMVRHISWQ